MQTFLITGATEQEREEKTKSLIDSSTSKFDIAIYEGDTIGIKDVRNIIRSLFLKPVSSPKKAVVLYEAQDLSIDAQNALLKTLEEPPENTVIILTAQDSELLLPTIVSRCQIIKLTTENLKLTTENQSLIISHLSLITKGNVAELLKLAQDVSKSKDEAITWLEKMILSLRQKLIEATIDSFSNNNNSTIVSLLNYSIAFQKTHTILKTTNANLRLTLENLLLNIP